MTNSLLFFLVLILLVQRQIILFFIKVAGTSFIALLIYVDDRLVAGNNMKDIEDVKNSLNTAFKIKDLGHSKFFSGLEIARTKNGIHIYQRKYALEILADAGMLNAKPTVTPMTKKNEKFFDQNSTVHDIGTYRRIIGRLLY